MRLTLDPSLEYGVVLEGGGARGAYQIGALKAVTEAGIRIGAVAGASVGALNGAFLCVSFCAFLQEKPVFEGGKRTVSRCIRRTGRSIRAGGADNESEGNTGLHRMQASQLCNQEEQA